MELKGQWEFTWSEDYITLKKSLWGRIAFTSKWKLSLVSKIKIKRGWKTEPCNIQSITNSLTRAMGHEKSNQENVD